MNTQASLLTKQEVAEMLRTTPRTVERLQADGRLPVVRLGPKSVRYRREDVEAFIAEQAAS